MLKYCLLVSCIVIAACNTKQNSAKKNDSVVVKEHIQNAKINSNTDTLTRIFTLEGNFSSEGNEGRAFYQSGKIQKAAITFYGEMGKAVYLYIFKTTEINVSQQRYNYKTNFTEVKSDKDIVKQEEVNFTTDLNGKVISGYNTKADLDVFNELKKVVPFELN